MRWQGRRESDNVEDRRNSSGGPSMGGPGFRLPSGKGGLILLIVVLVAGYYGMALPGCSLSGVLFMVSDLWCISSSAVSWA